MRLIARSTIYVLASALALGLVACGGDDDDDPPIVVEGDPHTYVVDSVTIPLSPSDAEELGFDIDGDSTIDNQLGNILSALISAGGGDLDLQASIDDSVVQGEILLLANIRSTSLTQAANAGFSLYLGDNPSPAPCTTPDDLLTCGKHLEGTGSFDIAAGSQTDGVVGGNIIGGNFTGNRGSLQLQIAFGETAINLTLIEAQTRLTGISAEGVMGAVVGGAVPDANVQNDVIPAVHTAINDIITEDCPTGAGEDCGCTADSTGTTLLGIFDKPMSTGCPDCVVDCQVTLSEIRQNQLIVTLLRPDVDTDGDNEPDSLSIGVGATAVAGAFTPP